MMTGPGVAIAERPRGQAERAGLQPRGLPGGPLVRVSAEEIIGQPAEDFERAASHILGKNAELYRRLA